MYLFVLAPHMQHVLLDPLSLFELPEELLLVEPLLLEEYELTGRVVGVIVGVAVGVTTFFVGWGVLLVFIAHMVSVNTGNIATMAKILNFASFTIFTS